MSPKNNKASWEGIIGPDELGYDLIKNCVLKTILHPLFISAGVLGFTHTNNQWKIQMLRVLRRRSHACGRGKEIERT